MNTNYKFKQILFFVIVLSMYAPLRAETIDCTAITSLPYTISSSGIYCLTGNLSTSMTLGNAITINTNNVTIDLNGWRLGGLAAGTGTQTNGIYARDRKNITIQNGTLRGFSRGIFFSGSIPFTISQGNIVQNVRLEQNTYMGIQADGRGTILRSNQIVDTGGTTNSGLVIGILVYGPGARIIDNDVIGVNATVDAFGIQAVSAPGTVLEHNRVDDISGDTGQIRGIVIVSSEGVLVAHNFITNAGAYGILFASSTGKYMNNLTSNVTTGFLGGTAVGIND